MKYGKIQTVGNSLSVPSKNEDITKTLICLSPMYMAIKVYTNAHHRLEKQDQTLSQNKHSNFIVQPNTEYLLYQ